MSNTKENDPAREGYRNNPEQETPRKNITAGIWRWDLVKK